MRPDIIPAEVIDITDQAMNLLIKPTSHSCNLDCDYCFYKKTADLYPGPEPRMTLETAEKLISQALAAGDRVNAFCWQGGEPTLMGVDFFRRVVQMQERLADPDQVVENSIQTNGLLLDAHWAEFLHRNRILVGLSLDGPQDVHDLHRKGYAGQGSHARVEAAARLLAGHHVRFNILTLLTSANVDRPEELYGYLTGLGFNHFQFIPCVDRGPDGEPAPYAVSGDQVGEFYVRLFDLWLEKGFGRVSIRLFEDILLYILDGARASCAWLPLCDSYLLVEHNGDVYPCDFHVTPELIIDNISNTPLTELAVAEKRKRFARAKSELAPDCHKCPYVDFCLGDCTRNRIDGKSELCSAWKKLLGHIDTHPVDLRAKAMAARQAHQQAILRSTGRNDPCPCGSGLKFKKCCGK